ncbi:MAG: hypothetical protein ABIJ04_12475 [Bacteroidota bacterium]
MAERFTSDLTFILIALIGAAILGFIIGWLLRGGRIKLLTEEIASLKKKLGDCEGKLLSAARTNVTASNYDSTALNAVFGKHFNENDLKIVEGIGPVIEGILHRAGINTWLELSNTLPSRIRAILDAEDEEKFRIHDPATWPEQAGMAHRGEWKALVEYQEVLVGGKPPE